MAENNGMEGPEGLPGGFGPAPKLSPEAGSASEARKRAALLAGREPVGLWPLMLWAYGREMVRATCGTDWRPSHLSASDQSSLAWAISAGEMGAVIRGADRSGFASACCHDDALIVHDAVLRVIADQAPRRASREAPHRTPVEALDGTWLAGAPSDVTVFSSAEYRTGAMYGYEPPRDGLMERPLAAAPGVDARAMAFRLLIQHAEAGCAPVWDAPQPVWRCVPLRRSNGRPKHLYLNPHNPNVPNACEVVTVGDLAALGLQVGCEADYLAIRANLRERYTAWLALLADVFHMLKAVEGTLKRWRLAGLDVEPEPWRQGGERAA